MAVHIPIPCCYRGNQRHQNIGTMTNTSACVPRCVCVCVCVGSVRFSLGSNARPTLNISTFQRPSVFLQSEEKRRRRCGFQAGREKSCCKYKIIRIQTLSLQPSLCSPSEPHMLHAGFVRRVRPGFDLLAPPPPWRLSRTLVGTLGFFHPLLGLPQFPLEVLGDAFGPMSPNLVFLLVLVCLKTSPQ